MADRDLIRRNAPLFLLGALLAASLLTRCSAHNDAGSASAAGAAGTAVTASECHAESVASDCPLPASTCADAANLAYYSAPSCVGGQCQWLRATQFCVSGACVAGACGPSSTSQGGSGAGGSAGQAAGSGGAGAQPVATCSVSGGEAGAEAEGICTLPDSVCADPMTLLFFTNPRCVQGVCQADVHSTPCDTNCSDGCRLIPTK